MSLNGPSIGSHPNAAQVPDMREKKAYQETINKQTKILPYIIVNDWVNKTFLSWEYKTEIHRVGVEILKRKLFREVRKKKPWGRSQELEKKMERAVGSRVGAERGQGEGSTESRWVAGMFTSPE